MPKKLKIITLHYRIKHEDVRNYTLNSAGTLIEADAVVIDPEGITFEVLASSQFHEIGSYGGRPILYDSYSHTVIELFERRRKELSLLLQNGRTVFCFLRPKYDVNVIMDVTQSLKGARTINHRHLETISNYSILPYCPAFTQGSGNEISLNKTNFLSNLVPLKEFLYYEAYVIGNIKEALTLATVTSTNNPVGLIVPVQKGHIVFLPIIHKSVPSPRVFNFFCNFIKAMEAKSGVTSPPDWCLKFPVPGEKEKLEQIFRMEKEIEVAKSKLAEEINVLTEIQEWKGLLFEQGKPLEQLVMKALELLGFSVSRFKEGSIEHDIIFEASEGRALGEIEGKDNSAINVDKFRHLSANLDEDFERIGKYSKGVLIGNGYRLLDPVTPRACQFTEKVMEGSTMKSFSLLTTTELFKAVTCILKNDDEAFKRTCRMKILETVGKVVAFDIPYQKTPEEEKTPFLKAS